MNDTAHEEERVRTMTCSSGMVIVVLCLAGGLLGGPPVAETQPAAVTVQKQAGSDISETVCLTVVFDGKPVAHDVLIVSSKGESQLKSIPAEGMTIPVSTEKRNIYLANRIVGKQETVLVGNSVIGPVDGHVAVEAKEVNTVPIEITLLRDGKPVGPDKGVYLVSKVKNHFEAKKWVLTDEEGKIHASLIPGRAYHLGYRYEGRAGTVALPDFDPADIKDGKITFDAPKLAERTFQVIFMDKVAGEDQVAMGISGCEILGEDCGGMLRVQNGSLYLNVIPADYEGRRWSEFVTGNKYRFRLGGEGATRYRVAKGSEMITVGKAGEKTKIFLLPRAYGRVTFDMGSSARVPLHDIKVYLKVFGEKAAPWRRCVRIEEARIPVGKYAMRIWERDHRLYESTIEVKKGKQTVECELKPSPKTVICVVDEENQPLAMPGCRGLLKYQAKDIGPCGYAFRFPKPSKTRLAFDDRYPCALKITCNGYAPKILALTKGQQVHSVVLRRGQSVTCSFKRGDYEIPQAISEEWPNTVTFVAEKPVRMRVARVNLEAGVGKVVLETGTYTPVIELSAIGPGPDTFGLSTQAIICEPVEVSEKTETLDVVSIKIAPMADQLDGR